MKIATRTINLPYLTLRSNSYESGVYSCYRRRPRTVHSIHYFGSVWLRELCHSTPASALAAVGSVNTFIRALEK